MKNIKINRDPEHTPDEQLLKHKDFNKVLSQHKSSGVEFQNKSTGGNQTWLWYVLPAIAVGITVLLINQFSSNKNPEEVMTVRESNEQDKLPVEEGAIAFEKLEALKEDLANQPNQIALTNSNTAQENNDTAEDKLQMNDLDEVSSKKSILLKPRLATKAVFHLDKEFGLENQMSEIPTLKAYKNLMFQPVLESDEVLLNLSWDSVHIYTKHNKYFLELFKKGNMRTVEVQPVFTQENYDKANEVYLGIQ